MNMLLDMKVNIYLETNHNHIYIFLKDDKCHKHKEIHNDNDFYII